MRIENLRQYKQIRAMEFEPRGWLSIDAELLWYAKAGIDYVENLITLETQAERDLIGLGRGLAAFYRCPEMGAAVIGYCLARRLAKEIG